MNIQTATEAMLAQKRFELLPDEKPVIEGLSSYLKSSLNVMSCHAALTNHRIVVCKKNLIGGMALFGIAGVAVSVAVSLLRKQTKIMFQIPIAEIVGVKNIKHGFSRKYRFVIRSGENYDLQFTNAEQWEAELKILGVTIE